MPEIMQATLEQFLSAQVFAFVLTFARLGTAMMIMPGIGDSFVSTRVRLLMALGISFVLFPLALPHLPNPVPGTFMLFSLVVMEFLVGVFFGTVARIFMVALDTAGMVISMQSGLGSAQLFNPNLATQGSLIGAFFSVTGVTLLFVTDLHHLLIMGLVESYDLFPLGSVPDTGSMAKFIALAVTESFATGVKIAAPFVVVTFLIYVGVGILSRLMPQIQIFIITLPLQIIISLIMMSLVLSAAFLYWLAQFQNGMVFFLSNAGG